MGVCYCMKCRQKTEIKDGHLAYYSNGVPIEKGICSKCGSKANRILLKEEREKLKASIKEGEHTPPAERET